MLPLVWSQTAPENSDVCHNLLIYHYYHVHVSMKGSMVYLLKNTYALKFSMRENCNTHCFHIFLFSFCSTLPAHLSGAKVDVNMSSPSAGSGGTSNQVYIFVTGNILISYLSNGNPGYLESISYKITKSRIREELCIHLCWTYC